MTSLICATNRRNARSRVVFEKVKELFRKNTSDEAHHLIDLIEIDFTLGPDQYKASGQSPALSTIQDEALIPSDRFIFVIPEYNGGFAGMAKVFIDAVSIRKYKETFKGKKALLIGVAEGRAGNLRGLDHISQILMHIGVHVYPKKLPISRAHKLMENRELTDESTIKALDQLISDFLLF
ncbi:MAG: NAD(P)H-dependent oxidoreductase [Saprospiraceae bacterium]|nr:NAD(P)H-dependent oxidoreductase [Saprospiraceae bacterium]